MVNPGLAQVIQHEDICHTIIDLCSPENDLPPKIEIPKSQLQNLKSKLQNPSCNDILKKNSLKLTIVSLDIFGVPATHGQL